MHGLKALLQKILPNLTGYIGQKTEGVLSRFNNNPKYVYISTNDRL
jgi:hypothetical protein